MKYNYIKNKVKIIIEKNNSKNIFKICKSYKIFIVFSDFNKEKKEKGSILIWNNICFIGINRHVSKQEKYNILLHEFAHYILHDEKISRWKYNKI